MAHRSLARSPRESVPTPQAATWTSTNPEQLQECCYASSLHVYPWADLGVMGCGVNTTPPPQIKHSHTYIFNELQVHSMSIQMEITNISELQYSLFVNKKNRALLPQTPFPLYASTLIIRYSTMVIVSVYIPICRCQAKLTTAMTAEILKIMRMMLAFSQCHIPKTLKIMQAYLLP